MGEALKVRDLVVNYRSAAGRGLIPAVRGVSFVVGDGETVALVGESGSGKSTIARAIVRLVSAASGEIEIGGRSILHAHGADLRELRRGIQMVFQDPYSSLDPSHTVEHAVSEPLQVHRLTDRKDRPRRVGSLLESVGLPADAMHKYPGQLSGGQRQRAAIARALASGPSVVILDEAVSALDVSTQNVVLKELDRLRSKHSLSYLFITHNLSVVRLIADRTMVLYLGRIVESGPTADVMNHPRHPYTEALMASAPQVRNPTRRALADPIGGEVPSPTAIPAGCPFHPRCPRRTDICTRLDPALVQIGTQWVSCHHPLGVETIAPMDQVSTGSGDAGPV